MRIGITGAFGQFGWHLRCFFLAHEEVEVVCADRDTFANASKLNEFVTGLDVVVHLAGVNRAKAQTQIAKGNLSIAHQLVQALESTGGSPHLVYSSTAHIENDNIYGHSKRQAGEILAKWAFQAGAKFSNIIFPHLFGEYGRPNYNSVVSTFCWKVANGQKPEVHGDPRVELLHFHEASKFIFECINENQCGLLRPKGSEISVIELADRIQSMAATYQNDVMPELHDSINLRLFNIYRGFLYPKYYPVNLITHTDERGSLTETVKANNGGQTFFSTTKPGVTRGNHFHYHKVERFVVVKGTARISLRKLLTNEVIDFFVSEDEIVYIDMPTLHTHEITNVGKDELVTLFWSHELYDPKIPDTVFELVRP